MPSSSSIHGTQVSYFLTGTDTDVGKTIAAAWLVRHLDAAYWKPVQAGMEGESDTDAVRRLSGRDGPGRFYPNRHWLRMPMSPHAAAQLEGVEIQLSDFIRPCPDGPLVIEGAGGILVPLNERDLMIDLMVRLALPVIVVARTALGTINHTLMTLECLRRRELTVAGVILNGTPNASNRAAIAHYGAVEIIAEIPHLDPLTPEALHRHTVTRYTKDG
jgi:dethiobiotin synthase